MTENTDSSLAPKGGDLPVLKETMSPDDLGKLYDFWGSHVVGNPELLGVKKDGFISGDKTNQLKALYESYRTRALLLISELNIPHLTEDVAVASVATLRSFTETIFPAIPNRSAQNINDIQQGLAQFEKAEADGKTNDPEIMAAKQRFYLYRLTEYLSANNNTSFGYHLPEQAKRTRTFSCTLAAIIGRELALQAGFKPDEAFKLQSAYHTVLGVKTKDGKLRGFDFWKREKILRFKPSDPLVVDGNSFETIAINEDGLPKGWYDELAYRLMLIQSPEWAIWNVLKQTSYVLRDEGLNVQLDKETPDIPDNQLRGYLRENAMDTEYFNRMRNYFFKKSDVTSPQWVAEKKQVASQSRHLRRAM